MLGVEKRLRREAVDSCLTGKSGILVGRRRVHEGVGLNLCRLAHKVKPQQPLAQCFNLLDTVGPTSGCTPFSLFLEFVMVTITLDEGPRGLTSTVALIVHIILLGATTGCSTVVGAR